jgi:hypothetical protein
MIMLDKLTDPFEIVEVDKSEDGEVITTTDNTDIILDEEESGKRNLLSVSQRAKGYSAVILSLETPLSEEAFQTIDETFQGIKNKVFFTCIINTDLTAGQLAQVLSVTRSFAQIITRINLNHTQGMNPISVEFSPLIDILGHSDELTHFSMCGFTTLTQEELKGMAEVIATKRNLRSLTLSDCAIDEMGAQELVVMLLANESLYRLDLSHNPIGNGGVKFISDALKDKINISHLNLAHCNITGEGITAIGRLLQFNPSIIEINLDGSFGDRDVYQGFTGKLLWSYTTTEVVLGSDAHFLAQHNIYSHTLHNLDVQMRNTQMIYGEDSSLLDDFSLATTYLMGKWQDFKRRGTKESEYYDANPKIWKLSGDLLSDRVYREWDSAIGKALPKIADSERGQNAIRRIRQFCVVDRSLNTTLKGFREDLANIEDVMFDTNSGKSMICEMLYFTNFYRERLDLESTRRFVETQITCPWFSSFRSVDVDSVSASLLRVLEHTRNCMMKKTTIVDIEENVFPRYRILHRMVENPDVCNIL